MVVAVWVMQKTYPHTGFMATQTRNPTQPLTAYSSLHSCEVSLVSCCGFGRHSVAWARGLSLGGVRFI